MPRYFFNIIDGHSFLDTRGTELSDSYEAQAEAICFSGEILREMGAKSWKETRWRMEVLDEGGLVLFVLHFSAEERIAPGEPTKPSVP